MRSTATQPRTVLDDIRSLAGEYRQRATYVRHSNGRAAALYDGVAGRLDELVRAHAPAAPDDPSAQTEAL